VADRNGAAPRVVITGIGPVTPIGTGVTAFAESLRDGRSGVAPIRSFDASDLKVRIAAEVDDFEAERYMSGKAAKRMARFSQMAVAAAHLAVEDAGLDYKALDPDRVGVVVNTGGGGVNTVLEEQELAERRGVQRASAFFVPTMAPNMAACQVSIELGLQGPVVASVAACASSITAFIDAVHLIQHGEAEVVLTGGAESSLSALAVSALANMHALSRRNDDPQGASRPFDKDRDGFVMGEGAVVCVLETLDAARGRGAHVYAEVLGGGRCADAYHISAPEPDGSGAARAMRRALDSTNLKADDVDYICAHGTGTSLNDAAETSAIKQVFGEHAYRLAVSSPKSLTGHLMGAAGAVSVTATALAIDRQLLPPTINLDTPDPDCDLDYVSNQSREAPVRVALANGFGFGGQNAVVALARVAD
jgi:3-oxoacyl-[acyl-carrier-protein] synthase II